MVNTTGVIIAKTTQMTIHSRLKTLLTMRKKQKQIANLFPKKLLFFHLQNYIKRAVLMINQLDWPFEKSKDSRRF